MKRTEPSQHLYAGKPYTPSFMMTWHRNLIPTLNGPQGLAQRLRTAIERNVKEAAK